LILGRKKTVSTFLLHTPLTFTIDNNEICPTISTRDLGFIIDRDLTMEPHVNNVCRVGFFYLKNISRQRKYLNKPATRMLINAFVFSRLHYCGSLFYSVNQNLERKLQRLINYSGRLVGLLKHSDDVASLIKNEGWFSIRQLIHKNIAMLVHSCLYRCQPQLLRSLLRFEGLLLRSQITTRRMNDSTLLILCYIFCSSGA
jgi:hypothetical protein